MNTLTGIDDFFPYSEYRPHQKEMLTQAADALKKNQILLIDAPTGSGKSSLISALLSEAGKKKIIVAVRTNSQLDIFLNELQRIRQTKVPDLAFSYVFGKEKICPLFSEAAGDIYTKCDRVRDRVNKLFLDMQTETDGKPKWTGNPLEYPPYVAELEKQNSPENTKKSCKVCPYYANVLASLRGYHQTSGSADEKIRELVKMVVRPEKIMQLAGDYCPHYLLWKSLPLAKVVILNYHYLLRREIETNLLENLMTKPQDIYLLLDEAHNIGELVKGIYGAKLSERTLDAAHNELKKYRDSPKYAKGIRAMIRILDVLQTAFDAKYYDSPENRKNNPFPEWLNPDDIDTDLFLSHMSDGEWGSISKLLDSGGELIEKLVDENDSTTFPLYHVYMFIMSLAVIEKGEPYFVYLNKDETTLAVTFEKRVLDPQKYVTEFVSQYRAAVLCSGTLFPLEDFRRYYFNDLDRVTAHSVPNAFLEQNRCILCTKDYSSIYSRRDNEINIENGCRYILDLCKIPGNVGVFFPSYKLRNRFILQTGDEVAKYKQIFSEPQGNADEANRLVKEFMALPQKGGEGILFGVCGARWFEGLDFKGEMLNAVLVLGLPLSPIDAYQKKVNTWFEAKFGVSAGRFIGYTLPAMNKAVQALGRVLRTKDDRGVLVLGDMRYTWPQFRRGLPEWMRNEVKETESGGFEKQITNWWYEKEMK